jgi:hypothetical protein
MIRRAQYVLVGFVVLSPIAATVAAADPISVTGSVLVDDIPIERFVDVQLQIGGLRFLVYSSGEGPERRIFFPASQPGLLENGQPADLSSRITLAPTSLGQPVDIIYSGSFLFTAVPSVLMDCVLGEVGGCSSSSRFVFTGALVAMTLAGQSLFERQLVGSGHVSGWFEVEGGRDQGRLHYLSYEFDPAPVPEPTTLVLLGTGAAAFARNAWKRRRSTAAAQGSAIRS